MGLIERAPSPIRPGVTLRDDQLEDLLAATGYAFLVY